MMSLTTMSIVSLAVVLNLIVIVYKFQHAQWANLITDVIALTFVSIVMTGTASGATIGFISSAFFSIILLFYKPNYSHAIKQLTKIFDDNPIKTTTY